MYTVPSSQSITVKIVSMIIPSLSTSLSTPSWSRHLATRSRASSISTFTLLYFSFYAADSDSGDADDIYHDADHDVADVSVEVWVDRADNFGV